MSERTHELKTVAPYFQQVMNNVKRFEIRRNDRNFQVGDILHLREWVNDAYTGREYRCRVLTVLEEFAGIEPGYCVMSLRTL